MTLGLTLDPTKVLLAEALAADAAAYLASGRKVLVLPPGATAAPFMKLSLTACAGHVAKPARPSPRQKGVL